MENEVSRIIDYSGIQYKQGIPYFSKTNPDYCFYDMYVLSDYLEDNNLYEGGYCRNQCDQTEGRLKRFVSLNKYDSKGNTYIYAVRCECNKCLSQNDGSFDFEIIHGGYGAPKTECRKFGDGNRIELIMKNTGEKDITRENWIIHNIDGVEVSVDRAFNARVQETGTVFSVVQNQQPDLKPGEHTIELGLPDSDVKTIKVTCPNKESSIYSSEEECEQQTGKECSFTMCDYVPEGRTFEEVCGDMSKGWSPSQH